MGLRKACRCELQAQLESSRRLIKPKYADLRDRSRLAGDSLAPCPRIDARSAVRAIACDVMGTIVEMKAPLMSAGLDSIATTAFISTLAT